MTVVRQPDRPSWQRCIAVFAALLVAGVGFVQFVHLHEEFSSSGAVHSHCALCIFSHSPAAVTAERFGSRTEQAYTLGYDRDIARIPHLSTAIGGQVLLYGVPDVLRNDYRPHPFTVVLFLRGRPR